MSFIPTDLKYHVDRETEIKLGVVLTACTVDNPLYCNGEAYFVMRATHDNMFKQHNERSFKAGIQEGQRRVLQKMANSFSELCDDFGFVEEEFFHGLYSL